MKKLLYALLTLVLVIAAGVGVYFYQQRSIDDMNAKNKALTSKVKNLQSEQTTNSQNQNGQKPPATTTYTSEKGVTVTVTSPISNAKVTSPLTVKGTVPGSWSFESQFTVQLVDAQGNLIAKTPAKLQGDWMTDEQVPFTATLTFSHNAGTKGSLVLVKDNPSGLANNNDSVTIPVTF
jgi:uncharacterized protein YxeA